MTSYRKPAGQRVVILTGAAGGIGRAITETLLADGHCVAAVDRNSEALERLSAGLHGSDAAERLHAVVADLGVERSCQESVEAAITRFGRVEAVINNAGIGVSSLRPDAEMRQPAIEELTGEIWDRFFCRQRVRGDADNPRRPAAHEGGRLGADRQ